MAVVGILTILGENMPMKRVVLDEPPRSQITTRQMIARKQAELAELRDNLELVEDEMLPWREARVGETVEGWERHLAEHDRLVVEIHLVSDQLVVLNSVLADG